MDQPPAIAFTAFADVWPRAAGNGDRHRPMRHWHGRSFQFFLIDHVYAFLLFINFVYLSIDVCQLSREYYCLVYSCSVV